MTSPVVGQVSVEVTASARRLAADLRREVEGAFRGLDVSKQIQDAAGRAKVTIRADVDTSGIDAKLRAISAAGRGQKFTVGAELDGTGLARDARRAVAAAQAAAPDMRVRVDLDTSQAAAGARSLGSAAGAAVGGMSQLAASAAAAGGPLTIAAAAVVALGAAMGAAAPLAGVLGGALGALPAAAAGIGGAFAALKLGFSGISDAFKPKAGGGGGGGGEDPASRARRIAAAERGVDAARRGIAAANRNLESAERGLESAQRATSEAERRARQATEALSVARRQAKEDIEDLARSLSGAQLSEERAARDVEKARKELADAEFTQNPERIAEADLAYRESLQTLDEAKDRTADLGEEQAASARAGVEGSKLVQDALQDQRDAQRGVADAKDAEIDAANAVLSANDSLKASYDSLKSAQDALAEAQKKVGGGGGGGALGEVVKLAPAAQKFVDAIKALKPAFESLRLDVQQKLFAGLDKTVTDLGVAWLPTLKARLGGFATSFNTFFKDLGRGLAKPAFIEQISQAMVSVDTAFDKVAKSVSGPLVAAFGQLAAAAGPFIEQMGEEIAGVVDDFSRWIGEANKSGKLQKFFVDASHYLHQIFDIGKKVFSILGSVFTIIFGGATGDKVAKTPLATIQVELDKLAAWLSDPQNQQKVRDFANKIIEAFDKVGDAIKKVDGFVTRVEGWYNTFQAIKQRIEGIDWSTVGADLWDGLVKGISDGARSLGNRIAGLFWSGPNSLVGRIKSGLGIASPSTVMMAIGRNLVDGLINGIGARFAALRTRAQQIRTQVTNGVGNVLSTLRQRGGQFVDGLMNGLSARFGALRSRAIQLKNQVTSALGNAGSLLYNIGRSIISGLIDGIASRVAALGNYLRSIGTFIQDNKGPIEKDRKLLVGAGQAIMQGLIGGIDSQKQALRAELGSVTDLIGVGGAASLDHSLTASASIAAPPPQRMLMGWAPGTTGDQILDAFRDRIQVRYGGNVQTALGA